MITKKKTREQRYRIETTPQAKRDLAAGIPTRDVERIDARINALETDPRPRGCTKLQGTDDLYRVKQGDYRIIYQISDDPPLVTITNVRHRRDVYRFL